MAAKPNQTQPPLAEIPLLQRRLDSQAIEIETCRKELQIARTQVEQASEAQSVFMANMSHEIRTPMNIILGFSRLLLRENLMQEHRETLGFIASAGEGLLDLLNDLLDFSQIEAGELTIDHEIFSLEDILPELKAVGRSLVGEKNIRVDFELGNEIPAQLRGDGCRLQHILTNLLSNAVKFTSDGEVWIRAILTEENRQSVTVRFEVTDTGIGIPVERRKHIFDRFTQADGSSTRRYGGVGLGLTISKLLVDLLDGEIGVESEPGKGSTFWFTVAFEKADGAKISPAASERKSHSETTLSNDVQESPQVVRVLVVEDEPLDRWLVQRLLQDMHCRVDEAASGAIALQKTKDNSYDIIFMDVQLPDIDGLEVTKFIRSDDHSPNQETKIVAITAHALHEDRKRCLLVGMDDYLSKPINERMFQGVLQRFFPALRPSAAPELTTANTTEMAGFACGGNAADRETFPASERMAALLGGLSEALANEDISAAEENAHELRSLAKQQDEERLALDAFRVELAARRSDLEATLTALHKLLENTDTLVLSAYAPETSE